MYQDAENPAARFGEPGHAAGLPKDRSNDAQLPTQSIASLASNQANLEHIPGIIGRVRDFIYNQAPYPNADIALAGSLALLSGICGRAFNTYSGAGLNLYILLLAPTGLGKEAAASGKAKLLASVAATVPGANTFSGPALVSSAGLIKWLTENPSVVSIVGEFGYLLTRLVSPKAGPQEKMLLSVMLDLYGKSGAGSIVDPMAYSAADQRTRAIASPSFSVLGESVPGIVYEALTDRMVQSGLLPRFIVIEAQGQRPTMNEGRAEQPCPQLVSVLADLCAVALSLNSRNEACAVPANAEARELFRQFDTYTTGQINAQQSESLRELWNRALLNAIKLASLCAVGINMHNPIVTADEAMWATRMIDRQVRSLIDKFANDETGAEAGNEAKQLRKLRLVIREYVKAPLGKYEKSACTEDMHRDHIFSFKYLYNRLVKLPCFAEDKAGATRALDRAVRHLEENDEIRRVTPGDMLKVFGKATRSYGLTNEPEFMKGGD